MIEHGYNVTGIPTDVLIMVLGALLTGISGFIFRELRWLRSESTARGLQVNTLRVLVKQVCKKLDIPYSNGDE